MFNLLPNWFGQGRKNLRRKPQVQPAPHCGFRRHRHEQLEDRRMLALLAVSVNNDGLIAPNDGDLSLREAIAYVNGTANPQGDDVHIDLTEPLGTNDTIVFAPSLDGKTIKLDTSLGTGFVGTDLAIRKSMTIDATMLGAGLTIDAGNGADGIPGNGDGTSVFDISLWSIPEASAVTLAGLTITGGDNSLNGGGLYFDSSAFPSGDVTLTPY